MRRLEVERIDEMPVGRPTGADTGKPASGRMADTGQARHPLGLGPEMRPLQGRKFSPPTRVDGPGREAWVWCGARAPCLARTVHGRRRGTARRVVRLRGAL